MYKIEILTVGKHKETWLQEALSEYEKRLKNHYKIQWHFLKDDFLLEKTCLKEENLLCLTPQGISYTSEEFASHFSTWMESYYSRLCFVIGGAEGLSLTLLKKASHAISLSPLTFTHQLTRLVLLEQIYRADQINKGTHYHK